MLRKDFEFELPEELIAQYPVPERGASRLLLLDGLTGEYFDKGFSEVVELINPGDLLVFNDTRVIPARLFGRKSTGGGIEILIERLLNDTSCSAQIRASKAPKKGSRIRLTGNFELEVVGHREDLFVLKLLCDQSLMNVLQTVGHTPLPPYIKRADEPIDSCRYQTVYAKKPGAIAAPTAGLHFTRELINDLEKKGVICAYVTLHVGSGTFQPLRNDIVENHKMHSEWYQLEEKVCEQIRDAKKTGNRVIAVGTTSVRCLESATTAGGIKPFRGETDIFIYPGFSFQTVDAMITNFHLPGSTLLMLVCAFAGRENVIKAYKHAVEKRYRFFSYGDAMFISNSGFNSPLVRGRTTPASD